MTDIAKRFPPNPILKPQDIQPSTHEAHSSYRVMGPLCAIGQAAGVAAALMATLGKHDVRELDSAEIRHVLHEQGAFVEGEMTDPKLNQRR